MRRPGENDDTDLVGATLCGRWRIVRLLGRGGMSTVYEAQHRSGARVAIKVLSAELSSNRRALRRFLREARVANAIAHPSAVRIVDDDETPDGRPFLVMDMLDGETLRSRCVAVGGRMDVSEVLRVADRVLEILTVAHSAGVVHRDIKPANVFLTSASEVKMLDFGIASVRDEAETGTSVTQSGIALGTPAFMAPEQARGLHAQVDARSDVWAVGATMFYCLTGRHVHEGASTPNETLIFAATQPAQSLGAFRPDLPTEVVAIVDRALELEAGDRWASAAAMRAPISAFLTGARWPSDFPVMVETATLSEQAAAPRRNRRRLGTAWALGAGTVAVLAGGLVVASSRSLPPYPGSWACLEQPAAPSDPTLAVDIEFEAFDAFQSFTLGSAVDGGNDFQLLNYSPLAGMTIQACSAFDPLCTRPETPPVVTDDAGVAHLTVPGGFEGVYSMHRPEAFPALYYAGRLLAGEPRVTYPVSSVDYQVSGALGAAFGMLSDRDGRSGKGQLYVTAYDCADRQMPGMTIELTNVKAGVSFYVQNGIPNIAGRETDTRGTAGFIGVPDGTVAVEVARRSDKRHVGSMNVYVRSGGVTFVDVRPRVRP